MAKELIRDLEKVVNVAITNAFEDKYTMDFECEGVEPTLVEEKGSGNIKETFANIYPSIMWGSGVRPKNKGAEKYFDNIIEDAENQAEEEFPNDDDAITEYIIQDLDSDYAPWLRVQCEPNYYKNDRGFECCEMEIRMILLSYNGGAIEKYEPKIIKFSTVSMQQDINPNYIEDDDFEFEEGGYLVDASIIEEYIRTSISRYVAEF